MSRLIAAPTLWQQVVLLLAKQKAQKWLKQLGAHALEGLAATGQPVATFKVLGKWFGLVVREKSAVTAPLPSAIKVGEVTVNDKTFVIYLRQLP